MSDNHISEVAVNNVHRTYTLDSSVVLHIYLEKSILSCRFKHLDNEKKTRLELLGSEFLPGHEYLLKPFTDNAVFCCSNEPAVFEVFEKKTADTSTSSVLLEVLEPSDGYLVAYRVEQILNSRRRDTANFLQSRSFWDKIANAYFKYLIEYKAPAVCLSYLKSSVLKKHGGPKILVLGGSSTQRTALTHFLIRTANKSNYFPILIQACLEGNTFCDVPVAYQFPPNTIGAVGSNLSITQLKQQQQQRGELSMDITETLTVSGLAPKSTNSSSSSSSIIKTLFDSPQCTGFLTKTCYYIGQAVENVSGPEKTPAGAAVYSVLYSRFAETLAASVNAFCIGVVEKTIIKEAKLKEKKTARKSDGNMSDLTSSFDYVINFLSSGFIINGPTLAPDNDMTNEVVLKLLRAFSVTTVVVIETAVLAETISNIICKDENTREIEFSSTTKAEEAEGKTTQEIAVVTVPSLMKTTVRTGCSELEQHKALWLEYFFGSRQFPETFETVNVDCSVLRIVRSDTFELASTLKMSPSEIEHEIFAVVMGSQAADCATLPISGFVWIHSVLCSNTEKFEAQLCFPFLSRFGSPVPASKEVTQFLHSQAFLFANKEPLRLHLVDL